MKKILSFTLLSLSILTADADNKKIYKVDRGDTLWKIAKNFQTTPKVLKSLNGLQTDNIRVGMKLEIPTNHLPQTKTHQVKAGETLWKISRQHKVSVERLTIWNNLKDVKKLKPGRILRVSGEGTLAKAQTAPTSSGKRKSNDKKNVASKPAAKKTGKPAAGKPSLPTKGDGFIIVQVRKKILFNTFAKQHGMTVDQINALNGLELKPDTLLATGSELIVADLH